MSDQLPPTGTYVVDRNHSSVGFVARHLIGAKVRGKFREFDGEIETVAGEPWQYRNRVQLHIENGAIGYFEHGSHSLSPIERCDVSSPALNDAVAKLKGYPLRNVTTTVEFFTNETDIQVHVWDRVPATAYRVFDSLGTTAAIDYQGFRVSPISFFQVNRYLIDDLVNCATSGRAGEWAVDLYAGVGLFSVRLAEAFKRVTAVESSRRAFRDLQFNIERRELQVAAENQPAEDYLASLQQTPEFILADPPRTGLGKVAVRELVRLRAPRLTIVSCDPATLARDLQGLLAGGYRIQQMTMVDLFPQTFHLETVVLLELG